MHCFHKLREEDVLCPHCHNSMEQTVPAHHLKPGTRLLDRYVIGYALGEGGFGITYIGWDETLKMRVAIKEYFPAGFSVRNHNVSDAIELTKRKEGLNFQDERDRFLREAQRLARFSGKPGVVSVYNFFEANNTAYIVMEFLDGVTLMDVLRQKKQISPDSLFRVLDPVMQALELVHGEDLIHRDISPDNIMVLRDNTLKLLDFGAAREVADGHSLSVVLKPGYAPEEQYRTKGQQGPWTDIYALCATMYKCITGITPSVSLDRIAEDDLKTPSQLGIQIDPAREAALMRGLSVRMKDRFQNVRQLRIALGLAKEEETVHTTYLFTGGNGTDCGPGTKTTKTATADNGPGVTVSEGDPGSSTGGKPEVTVYDGGDKGPEVVVNDDPPKVPGDRNKGAEDGDGGKDKDTKGKTFPRKILFLLLAVIAVGGAVLFTITGALSKPRETLSQKQGNDSYTVSPVGQISGELKFDGNVVYRKDGDHLQLIDLQGNAVGGESFSSIQYLKDDLYLVRSVSTDINNLQLISRSGETYWETPAASASWIGYEDTRHRYLLVYFAGERTYYEDECVICRTETGNYYNTPVDNCEMYTGYILAYDLENMRFVPDLPQLTRASSVHVCGESLLWGESWNTMALYNADGKPLAELGSSASVGDGFYLIYESGTYRIFDENGNQTFASNKHVGLISNSGLFQIRTDENKQIPIDPYGNPLFNTGYESIDRMVCGNLVVREDDKVGLVSLTGKEILPVKYEIITQINDWYCYARYKDDYTLLSPEGIIATGLRQSPTELTVVAEDRALVLNKRETYVDVSAGYKRLKEGLISLCDDFNGLYGVVDLYAGIRLLPSEYETVAYAAGYLYGYQNGAWDVFELTYNPDPESAAAHNSPEAPAPTEAPATEAPLAVRDITLKVWTPEPDRAGNNSWLLSMERAFEAAHPEYRITWENDTCSESDIVAMVSADPAAAADVYMFTNDQIEPLIQAGALTPMGNIYLEQIQNDVSDTYIRSLTATDGYVYGFPMAPNTWFMYYNKSMLTEEDVTSLEACLSKGAVSFQTSNPWYLPSFFFAAGGSMFGENYNNAAAGIQFGGEVGYAAGNALLDFVEHVNFRVDDGFSGKAGLMDGSVAAYFSGSWDYADLYKALGKNLGAVAPPTVMIDGETRQLKAYAGSKAIGVNPHCENHQAALQFAAFLASADSQLVRFRLQGITPAVTALRAYPEVASSIVSAAESDTMAYASVVQPSIPEMASVWLPVEDFGEGITIGAINRSNIVESIDTLNHQLTSITK